MPAASMTSGVVSRTVAAGRRPRLLFLAHRLPFPPHNGAAIRTYNVLRLLSREYDIVALCFDRLDTAAAGLRLEERLEKLRAFGEFETFAIAQQQSRLRFLWDHLRSITSRRAYTYFVHEDRAFGKRLHELLGSEDFDLVHVDSLDLVRFLPDLAALPVVCTHHNVESALLHRRAENESSVLRRAYLHHQAKLLESEERFWLPRIALNVAVSDEDARALTAIAPGSRCVSVPNGVDADFFVPRDQRQEGCVFVGGTTWYPNRDALSWFVSDVLPTLRGLGEHAPITWVGRASEQEKSRYNGRDGVVLTGYVDDIRDYVGAAACFIAPLRVGGGTRLKILDAWSMGKAVVSTSIGCEGLAASHGENILIADDPRSFAEAISLLLNDIHLRTRLGDAARQTVERCYAWKVIGDSMLGEYRSILGVAPVASREHLSLVKAQLVEDGSGG